MGLSENYDVFDGMMQGMMQGIFSMYMHVPKNP
jgi:hypothetical protein